jgi:hypothetical protein
MQVVLLLMELSMVTVTLVGRELLGCPDTLTNCKVKLSKLKVTKPMQT